MATQPDLSQITDYLFVSSLPQSEHAQHVLSLGIRLIISMPVHRAPKEYRRPPFQFIHLPTFDSPFLPIPQFMLRRGVAAALPVIQGGAAVLVHCQAGKHRSVAMSCCILIAEGYSAEAAMRLVHEKRALADPYVGYIRKRIEVFESDWKKTKSAVN